ATLCPYTTLSRSAGHQVPCLLHSLSLSLFSLCLSTFLSLCAMLLSLSLSLSIFSFLLSLFLHFCSQYVQCFSLSLSIPLLFLSLSPSLPRSLSPPLSLSPLLSLSLSPPPLLHPPSPPPRSTQ